MQQMNASNAKLIDVSHNNGAIDWSLVAKAGISGVWVKATEGATLVDPSFYTNYISAKKAGILRGAYCFARPATSTATDEANSFVDKVLAAGGFDGLPPVLDLEDDGGKTPQELATFVLTFESIVKKRTGKQILLYSYVYFIEKYLNGVVGQLNHIPLWLANYAATVPDVKGWNSWTFLQYSETGSVNGISGHVDLDVYAGTTAELLATYGSGAPKLKTEKVQINGQDYADSIVVNDSNYILWGALEILKTPFTHDGSVFTINGAKIDGYVYEGQTYLPWQSLAIGVEAHPIDGGFNYVTPAPKVETVAPVVETASPVSDAKKAELVSLAQQLMDAVKAL